MKASKAAAIHRRVPMRDILCRQAPRRARGLQSAGLLAVQLSCLGVPEGLSSRTPARNHRSRGSNSSAQGRTVSGFDVRTNGSTWQRYCLTVNSTNHFTEYLRDKSFDETGRPLAMARDPRTLGRPRTIGYNRRKQCSRGCSGKPQRPSDALVALASDLRIAVVREVAANPASQVGIATGIS
jgi:hypothetical protein